MAREKLDWNMEMIGKLLDEVETILADHDVEPCYPYEDEEEVPCYRGEDCKRNDCPLRKKEET